MTSQNVSNFRPLSTRSLPALLSDSSLLFLIFAEGILALGAVIGLLFLKAKHPLEFAAATALTESGWPLLSSGAIFLAALACALAYRATVAGEKAKAVILIALAVTAGADFAAVRAIEGVRLIREHEVAAGAAAMNTQPAVAEDAGLENAPADPEKGAELYAATCAACHGPNGGGKARQGAPIAGSAFTQGLDEAELVSFLKKGRQPSDPNSVMRMVMPPKGGNPTLTEKDLKDVAAYTLELASQAPASGSVAAEPSEPAFEIHKSIVPPSKEGPEGLSALYRETRSAGPSSPLSPQILSSPNRFPRLFLFIGLVHGVLIAGGLVVLAAAAFFVLRDPPNPRIQSVLFFVCAHVQMMAVIWIFLMPYLYGPA